MLKPGRKLKFKVKKSKQTTPQCGIVDVLVGVAEFKRNIGGKERTMKRMGQVQEKRKKQR